MKKITLTLLCGLFAASPIFAAAPVGIANVMGAKSWESMQNPPYGMYEFSMEASGSPKLISSKVVPANFGAVYADGKYFVIEGIATSASSFITNYIYDAETWTKITDFQGEPITAFDMVWDETTGNVYGYFHNFTTNEEFFGTIDINTGKTTKIATLAFVAYGMGCDVEGHLYAISKTGDLYSLDKTNGAATKIGNTGCVSKWTTSGAIDSATRTFYYVCCGDEVTTLYAINLATAAATKVKDIDDNMELIGLYFPEASALPGAPAAPADLALNFPGGALAGSIEFTVPDKLFGGEAATGEANYKVIVNGVQLKAATAAYGSKVAIPYSVDAAGECEVKVMLSNAAGSAPTARLKQWLGPDTPAPVGTVTIAYDGKGTFTLSWPEARSLHGGWFDPATVSYNVARYNSESSEPTLFNGITENSFTDKVSVPYEDEYATYHYNVAAVFGTTVGSYTSSEYYTIGSRKPPFSEEFNARYQLGKFTILEGDKKDNERWSYDSKAVTVGTSTSVGADDYLILPPLELETGMKYEISFDAKGKYSTDVERLEVLAGVQPTIPALTDVIAEPFEFKSTTYNNYKMTFMPKVSGSYFIAIHAISDPNKGAITVDNIKVSKGEVLVGIESVDADVEVAPEYYTLQGVKVANPASGIYIERRGEKVRKVMIRK